MIVHSNFQIVRDRERRFDALLHKPYLDRSEAEHFLCYYLLKNIEFTCYTLLGVRLLPYQEIIIRTMLRKPYILTTMTRGGGKTFLNGVYAALRCIITPGSKIVCVGSNRRQARFIFAVVKAIRDNKRASLFREVCSACIDAPEESYAEIKGAEKVSRISAVPIASGDRIRGFRASVLLADEANLISEDIFNAVLKPMTAVGIDPVARVLRAKKERELIEAGVLKEEEATEFDSNQMIMSSSAGYQFSFLYKQYCEYKRLILEAKDSEDIKLKKEASKYAIIQLSYEAIDVMSPKYLDMDSIMFAKRTLTSDRFLTEYCAQFATDSIGYIPRSLLESKQLKLGETPIVEIKGDPNYVYIMAIDPSSGENTQNDFFAIVVLRLDLTTRKCVCVYASASTGKGWPHYVGLVKEVIRDFQPKYIICDSFGGGVQMASLLRDDEYINKEKGERKLEQMEKDDLTTYCHADNRILRMNTPTNQFNEQSNVNLKSMLEHDQFWFAAPLSDENGYNKIKDPKIIDKLEEVSEMIDLAKNQISLIIPTQNSNGLTIFSMPDSLGQINKKERVRKDLYSAALLGAWGVKEYLSILDNAPKKDNTYNPVIATA